MSVGRGSVASVQRNNSGASDVRSDLLHHGNYIGQKRNSMCSMASSAEGDHSFSFYRYNQHFFLTDRVEIK